MASNKMFTTVNLDGCYVLDTHRIIGGAEVLADKLERDFAPIFDDEDKLNMTDHLQDIADNIDLIREKLCT